VAHDSDFRAQVVAVQAHTGKLLWQAAREPHKACYSTPCILERAGQPPLLAVVSSANVAAYDLATGAVRWSVPWQWARSPLRTVSSPLVANHLLIAASGDGGGDRLTMAVGLDRDPPAPVWELRRGIPYVPMMVAHGEHLFYLNDQGVAGCLLAATGATIWTQRLGGNVSASLIGLGQTLVGVNEEGEVFLFAALPKYQNLGKLSLGEGVIASPAAAGGRLYLRGKQHLFCFAVE
jgi:outer membrane protein assembly factor BamB